MTTAKYIDPEELLRIEKWFAETYGSEKEITRLKLTKIMDHLQKDDHQFMRVFCVQRTII